MKRPIQAALLLVAAVATYQAAIIAGSTKMPAPSAGPRDDHTQEMAVQTYNSGVSYRDKGKKAEEQLATQKSPTAQSSRRGRQTNTGRR